jgi:hypothetical protein
MGRSLRVTGSLLVVAGMLLLVWAFVVWRWQDPFTRIYTALEQRELESSYEARLAEHERQAPSVPGASGGAARTPARPGDVAAGGGPAVSPRVGAG